MSTTTKKELVDRIAQNAQAKHGLVKTTVQAFLEEIIAELGKGNRLEFRGFGVFEPRDCAPRTAQNPKTLERIHVPAKRTVKFKPGRLMKQRLAGQNVEEKLLVQT
jgi:integration host factor subunit beta